MTTQPEALRLADYLTDRNRLDLTCDEAAAELRRLHETNEAFGKRQEWWNDKMFELEQQRDELLAAGKLVIAWFEAEDDHSKTDFYQRMEMCRESEAALRAAIAKVEGGAA